MQEARQKHFSKGADNSHWLELDGEADWEQFCGRIVYVIVRCGVQGLIYPVKTDIPENGDKIVLTFSATIAVRRIPGNRVPRPQH